MVDNDTPGAWSVWATGTRCAGFMKGITKHCYSQNIKALGLMVSGKKIFLSFPHYNTLGISVAMETRVPVRSGPKRN